MSRFKKLSIEDDIPKNTGSSFFGSTLTPNEKQPTHLFVNKGEGATFISASIIIPTTENLKKGETLGVNSTDIEKVKGKATDADLDKIMIESMSGNVGNPYHRNSFPLPAFISRRYPSKI